MRTSEAALALIVRQPPGGQREYLTQWSDRWQMFSLVGGHIEEGETPRECLIRELKEELEVTDEQFRVAESPVKPRIEYVAFSHGSGVETLYRMELFKVEILSEEAFKKIETLGNNRWQSENEIVKLRTTDDKPISEQVRTLLVRAGVTMLNNVVFSSSTRRKLSQRTARKQVTDPDVVTSTMHSIACALTDAFGQKNTITIVQNMFGGFNLRDGEFILQVEVISNGKIAGQYIVKLNRDASALKRELDAWQSCKPDGLSHDLVLTSLDARNVNGILKAIVYSDAGQVIGVERTVSLEDAMVNCILYGNPSYASIAECLFLIYERLGHLLYSSSFTWNPIDFLSTTENDRLNKHRLENVVKLSSVASKQYRRTAITLTEQVAHTIKFYPPEQLIQWVFKSPQKRLPTLRRGKSHGDLHGRNIIVGLVGNRAVWPMIFDFADMGRNNLIAWDFVKLEVELKLRVYPQLFSGTCTTTYQEVIRLEDKIHELTQIYRNSNTRPTDQMVNDTDSPEERLIRVILTIRMHAENQLGLYHNSNRDREWLAEYYFVLALYGINAIRFDNLTNIQRQSGYIAAGLAAARYSYSFEK
jgi:8-oxo-dGTP pyrophosphatase MutT (NUDIX family)